MEEASNGDRHDRGDRRRTVSGAIPDLYNNEEQDQVSPIEAMRFPWSSPSAPTSPVTPKHPQPAQSPTKSSSGRKRSLSGSILSKLNILRSNGSSGNDGGSVRPPSREQRPASGAKAPTSPTKSFFSRKSVDEDAPTSPTSPPKVEKERGGALSAALKQSSKTRKRKGSLRKTALLGGRGIVPAGRERKGSFSLLQRTAPVAVKEQSSNVVEHRAEPQYDGTNEYAETFDDEDSAESMEARSRPQSLRHQLSYESPVAASSSDSSWTEAAAVSQARLSLLTEHHNALGQDNSITPLTKATKNELGSPVDAKSPTSQASTTSSDDLLTFHHHPTKPSYFPHLDTTTTTTSLLATRRRSSNKRRSPLSRTLSLSASTPYPTAPTTLEPYDYTSTSYWGWIILFATWITFVVGMGSCLGIWSWAWDVGVTPVAPPELENDETLPIVGYYPALIVLTGVVAWVWITVAWVGMKYFRHAKIEV
ncbi:hypothetical protein LTR37_006817 [Vermiconidia calcicola]|uniref:Uncharacterized protein n=1 Tax=Vermiconidia calcicola TaxID=1690605 RepID=A0ACC3NF29_9PEZI|nr:hypothetical protein LTR37_006817 [Vermiconidia calcicola]